MKNIANFNIEIFKIILQAEGINLEWDENKVKRSSDGRFAKNSNLSSTITEPEQKIKPDTYPKESESIISAKINKSMQYVTEQIGLAQRMTKKVADSFQKVLDDSVSHGVKLLQDLGVPVEEKHAPGQEVLKSWCDRLKKEFIDKPIEDAKPLVKATIDNLEKALETTEGQLCLAVATGAVVGCALAGLVIFMSHLTPMMNVLLLYVLFKEFSAFSKYQVAQYAQEKYEKQKQEQLQEKNSATNLPQPAKFGKEVIVSIPPKKEVNSSTEEKPVTVRVRSKFVSIKDDPDFQADWHDIIKAIHEKDEKIKQDKKLLRDLKDSTEKIRAKMQLDRDTLLRLHAIDKFMYPDGSMTGEINLK